MVAFPFKLFVTLCYIPYVLCQYTTIWLDHMEESINWNYTGTISWATSSSNGQCAINPCHRTREESWIRRETDVSSYSSLRVNYTVGSQQLGDEGQCRLYSSYTNDSLQTRKLMHFDQGVGEVWYLFPENAIILPDASQASTVWLWFETHFGGYDYCYWDEVSLEGIIMTSVSDTITSFPTTLTQESTDLTRYNYTSIDPTVEQMETTELKDLESEKTHEKKNTGSVSGILIIVLSGIASMIITFCLLYVLKVCKKKLSADSVNIAKELEDNIEAGPGVENKANEQNDLQQNEAPHIIFNNNQQKRGENSSTEADESLYDNKLQNDAQHTEITDAYKMNEDSQEDGGVSGGEDVVQNISGERTAGAVESVGDDMNVKLQEEDVVHNRLNGTNEGIQEDQVATINEEALHTPK